MRTDSFFLHLLLVILFGDVTEGGVIAEVNVIQIRVKLAIAVDPEGKIGDNIKSANSTTCQSILFQINSPVNASSPLVEIQFIAAHVIRRLVDPGLLEPVMILFR